MAATADISAVLGLAARRRLAGFVRTLRDSGFAVGLAETRDALAVMASPAAARPSTLRAAFRALFCAGREDWRRFDEIFAAVWQGVGMRQARQVSGTPPAGQAARRRSGGPAWPERWLGGADHVEHRPAGEVAEAAAGAGRRGGASQAESLAAADLRHLTDPDDLAAAHALAEDLARAMRVRLLRRERARDRGRRLDLRRTIHASVGHGGTPVELVWRQPRTQPLKLVVLLDASGSMSLYTGVFFRFLHGVVAHFARAEAFVFHTRLAQVSDSLRDRDPARALDRMALWAHGIGGGTRIGDCLADFNRWHAARVLDQRSAVLIVSDGYDTGPPDRLAAAMRQLRRRCRRIVWLNPLLGWQDYSPEARGMQAALPYVDLFATAHSLDSLAALEPYLARL